MRVNNIQNTSIPVYKAKPEIPQDEYDKILQKRGEVVAKSLMIASGLATAGLYYTITKMKNKESCIKIIFNKIKNLLGFKSN